MSDPSVLDDKEIAWAAASVLCLTEGAGVPLGAILEGLAPADALQQIARRLTEGDRASRARAMAAALGRIALDLEGWGVS